MYKTRVIFIEMLNLNTVKQIASEEYLTRNSRLLY